MWSKLLPAEEVQHGDLSRGGGFDKWVFSDWGRGGAEIPEEISAASHTALNPLQCL
jgi:hypothetical protein